MKGRKPRALNIPLSAACRNLPWDNLLSRYTVLQLPPISTTNRSYDQHICLCYSDKLFRGMFYMQQTICAPKMHTDAFQKCLRTREQILLNSEGI